MTAFKCLPLALRADVCYYSFSNSTSIKLANAGTMPHQSGVMIRVLGTEDCDPPTFSILFPSVAAHLCLQS